MDRRASKSKTAGHYSLLIAAPVLFVPWAILQACTESAEIGSFRQTLPDGTLADGGSNPQNDGSAEEEDTGPPLPRSQARIAASSTTTCAIETAGGVVCWGDNRYGGLGNDDPDLDFSASPVSVRGLDAGVAAVFGGSLAQCALKHDGRVVCWGDSVFGEWSGGGTSQRHFVTFAPWDAPGLSDVATFAVGLYFHCALTRGKLAKCYGLNSAGQVGNGSLADQFTPVDVMNIGKRARAVAAADSGFSACVVTMNGALQCWGANQHGQLGDGTTTDSPKPVAVQGLGANVTAVATGRDHTCAVVSGHVECWGSNTYGQLGDGSTTSRLVPKPTTDLPPIVALATGAEHTCSLSEAGAVHCWGSYKGFDGALSPTLIVERDAKELVAGGHHSCALLANNVLRCWGFNDRYQLGRFADGGAL